MSDLTLIFGNKNYSSWSLRPWVFMKQFQVPFEEKRIALFTDTTNQKLEQYNSDFKVPILQDGDLIIWDSLAILEYISEQYLDNSGWPSDFRARALARSISAEMHSSFTNVRNEMPMNCRKVFNNISFTSNALHEIERITSLWSLCHEKYGAQGEWLFGEYSIADAMYAPVALRFAGYSVPLNGYSARYVQSVLNQPCIKDWIAAGKQEKEVIAEDEIETLT